MAGLVFKINADFDRISKLKKELSDLEAQVKKFDVNKNPKEIDSLMNQINALKKEYRDYIKELENAYNVQLKQDRESGKEISNLSKQADEYKNMAQSINNIIGNRAENLNLAIRETNLIRLYKNELKEINYQEKMQSITAQEANRKRLIAISAINQHKQVLSDLNRVIKNQTKEMNAYSTSMVGMSQTLERMRIVYRNLSESVRISPYGQKLKSDINELNAKLSELDAGIGNYHRNIGNYASGWNGLQFSLQQVIREAPSLAISLNTFFLAISNNIPILVDEINRAKKEYKAFVDGVAAGNTNLKKVQPVWRQLLSSLLSWQSALIVGLTILPIYGKDIVEWGKKLLKVNDILKDVKEANKELTASFVSEQSQIDLLFDKLNRVQRESIEYNNVKDKIISKYGKYLEGLNAEIASLRDVEGAYKAISAAALQSAKDRAIEKATIKSSDKYAKVYSENVENIKKLFIEKFGDSGEEFFKEFAQQFDFGKNTDFSKVIKNIIDSFNEKVIVPTGYGPVSEYLDNDIRDYIKKITDAREELEKQIKYTNESFGNWLVPDEKKVVKNKDYWEKIKNDAIEAIDAIDYKDRKLLESGNFEGVAPKTVKLYNEQKKLINEAKKALESYNSIDTSNTDKNIDKYTSYAINAELSLNKEWISIMKDGRDKRLAESEQEWKDRKKQIEEEYIKIVAEYKKQGKKVPVSVTEVYNKRLSLNDEAKIQRDNEINKKYEEDFKKREESLTEYKKSEEQKRIDAIKERYDQERKWAKEQLEGGGINQQQYDSFIKKADKAEAEELLEHDRKAWQEYYKEYGDYQEKRLAITQYYDDLIAKSTTDVEKSKYIKDKEKAIEELDRGVIQESDLWIRLFSDAERQTNSYIENTIREVQQLIDYLNGVEGSVLPEGITKEVADSMKGDVKVIESIMEGLIEKRDKLNKRNPFKNIINGFKDLKNAGDDANKKFAATKDIIGGLNALSSAIGQIGDDLSGLGGKAGEVFGEISNVLGSTASLAEMGLDFGGTTGAIIGGGIGLVSGLIGALSGIGDKKREKEIQRLQKQINALDEAYSELGKSIDKAYSSDASQLIDQQNQLLIQQRALIQQQMAEEREKKHTDNGKLEEYQQRLNEINSAIDDNLEKRKDAIFGEDIKSAIDNFAEAYANAWSEGDDRAKASKDIVKNMIKNMIIESIKAASSKPMQDLRDKLLEFWADGMISAHEKVILDDMAKQLTEKLDQQFSWADDYLSGDSINQQAASKGFQAMSQDTGEELNGRFTALQISGAEILKQNQIQTEIMLSIYSAIAKANFRSSINIPDLTSQTTGLINQSYNSQNTTNPDMSQLVQSINRITDTVKKLDSKVNDLVDFGANNRMDISEVRDVVVKKIGVNYTNISDNVNQIKNTLNSKL